MSDERREPTTRVSAGGAGGGRESAPGDGAPLGVPARQSGTNPTPTAAGEARGTEESEWDEEPEAAALEAPEDDRPPNLVARARGGPRRRMQPYEARLGTAPAGLKGTQRLLILDTWLRSKLPATEFSRMVGLSQHTLYAWKRRFEELGPSGLDEGRRGAPKGSRMPEPTRRAILLMKQTHPEWGCERIHLMLLRSEGFAASAAAVSRVLQEEGYETVEAPTRPHEPVVRRFERARPNQLWQSDLFTFLLRRENRRVYMVAFMDDHSRFLVSYGIHASSSGALVRETLEAGIANYGAPQEVLTDNGPQYATWRGKSAFTYLCERRGIRHLVARPRRPQTLGKVERFWGSLWRECLQAAIFQGLDEARARIGHFIDYYNFQRPHQGIEGLVPADRYFEAAPQVRESLRARVAQNALDLAPHGVPRKSFYMTGRVGDESISLHGEGARVVLTHEDGRREEVDLASSGRRVEAGEPALMPEPVAVGQSADPLPGTEDDEELPAPGTSPLDEGLELSEPIEEDAEQTPVDTDGADTGSTVEEGGPAGERP